MPKKLIIKWGLIAIALPFGLAVSAVLINVGANNYYLLRFSNQLFSVQPPAGIEVVSMERSVGLLRGNGNHCDFLASVTLRSEIGEGPLQRSYGGLKLTPAVESDKSDQNMTIENVGPDLFKIEIFDAPNAAGFDPRCQ